MVRAVKEGQRKTRIKTQDSNSEQIAMLDGGDGLVRLRKIVIVVGLVVVILLNTFGITICHQLHKSSENIQNINLEHNRLAYFIQISRVQ